MSETAKDSRMERWIATEQLEEKIFQTSSAVIGEPKGPAFMPDSWL